MKTPEDEAFEDIERRQGGGFQAKRQMAADKQEPAQESWREFASDYECGFIDGMQKQAQSSVDKAVNMMAQPAQEPDMQTGIAYQKGFHDGKKAALAQPVQEPVNLLEARRIADEYGTPDSQVDSGNLYFALSKCLEHIDAQLMQEPVAQEKIHALKPMLEALRIKQVVSFSESQNLLAEVANKSGMLPPAFEISGNQWCALVNLAVARFGNNALPVQPEEREWVGLTDEEREGIAKDYSLTGLGYQSPFKAIEAKLKDKNT